MNKIKDGLYLIYVKEETMYPVALSQKEWDTLQFLGSVISNPMTVIDQPIGQAVNLLDKKEATKK